jgi:hypothetical protein
MNESTETRARERLEAFVGEWSMEAGPPDGAQWPGKASVSFEWMEGAPLLLQRWHVDMPEAPDGMAAIGCDGKNDDYFQLYTDERDVQRLYAMSLADGVWKLWRDGEPFSQRFEARFSEDGNTITGRWELAEDGRTWETDFDVTYTRVG